MSDDEDKGADAPSEDDAPSKRKKSPKLPDVETFLKFDYRIGEWAGRPNYGCPWPGCAVAALNSETVAEHVFDRHLSINGGE
jgi:hypothetical protein